MKIEIITKVGCSACNWLKNWLSTNKHPYEEHVIGETITRDDVIQRYPDAKVVPIVLLDGVWIGTKEDAVRVLMKEKNND